MDRDTLVLLTFGVTFLGLAAYVTRRDQRSVSRIEARQCVRCGRPTDDPIELVQDGFDVKVPLLVCERCAARTQRNHRLVFWAFTTLCTVTLVVVGIAVSRDMRRAGTVLWDDVVVAVGSAAMFFIIWRIFHRGLGVRPVDPRDRAV